jgi:hypothetical protein
MSLFYSLYFQKERTDQFQKPALSFLLCTFYVTRLFYLHCYYLIIACWIILYTVTKILVLKSRKILIEYNVNFTPKNSMKIQKVAEV